MSIPEINWDTEKNLINIKKHKLNFEEARTVFEDNCSIEFEAFRNGEYRIVRIGKTATKFIILIVYAFKGNEVRIISARQADKDQRNLYIKEKFKKQENDNSNS
jgi:uncharacterized protein